MNSIGQTVVAAVLLATPLPLLSQTNAEPPLPSVATVLERVARQTEKESDNDREFNRRYGYTRTKVTEYRNGKGDLKKREVKKIANDPSTAPVAYRPEPGKSTPEPKSGAVQSEASAAASSTVRGKAFERRDFSLDNDLLGRFEFDLVGRKMVDGRPMLMLDFKPAKRDLPERTIKDRFINKAAGRVWVDEADYVIAKANVYLTEAVNVVGGLVGAVWRFNYSFDRERTTEGLWFTRAVDWHVEGREVILRRVIDYHEGKTGVRKVW